MLTSILISEVRQKVEGFWREKSKTAEFIERASGKEIGHRIADYVDDKTTAFVKAHFCVAFETRNGKAMARSMGDLWLECGGIYHPVNIKTGITPDGQPNMVSLKKLLTAILENRIDSYYLLMVKFEQTSAKAGAAVGRPKIYLIDMLDYLGYVAFDSGPGQIMLKAKSFYANIEGAKPRRLSLLRKAERLMALLEKGDKDLIRNRSEKRRTIRKQLQVYRKNGVFTVTPENQAGLMLR